MWIISVLLAHMVRIFTFGKIQKLFKSSIKRKFPGFITYGMIF